MTSTGTHTKKFSFKHTVNPHIKQGGKGFCSDPLLDLKSCHRDPLLLKIKSTICYVVKLLSCNRDPLRCSRLIRLPPLIEALGSDKFTRCFRWVFQGESHINSTKNGFFYLESYFEVPFDKLLY